MTENKIQAELVAALQAAERKLVEVRAALADADIKISCTDEIVKVQNALIKVGA